MPPKEATIYYSSIRIPTNYRQTHSGHTYYTHKPCFPRETGFPTALRLSRLCAHPACPSALSEKRFGQQQQRWDGFRLSIHILLQLDLWALIVFNGFCTSLLRSCDIQKVHPYALRQSTRTFAEWNASSLKRDITNISVVTTLHASLFMHPQFHVILSVMSMEGFMCLLSIVENSSPYDTIIA